MIRQNFVEAVKTLTEREELTPFQQTEICKTLDWGFGPYDEVTIDDLKGILKDVEKEGVIYKKHSDEILETTQSKLS